MAVETPSVQPSSLRTLLPRLFSRAEPQDGVGQVLRTVKKNHPRADLAVIERAFRVARQAHEGQLRKSGEPYITHPVAVAQILADLGLGPKTVSAALLHDTVEDTGYSLEQLRVDFGEEMAMLVDGVTKLDKVKYGDHAQAETVRKMIIAMSKDIRVLVVKLADRLHNARTWGFVPAASAAKKAQETLDIYAPLAHRLGIQTIKAELEDLSFAVLHPKLFVEIESLVRDRSPEREAFVDKVIDTVKADLRHAKVRADVVGRPKQFYSIYQKMVNRGRDFADIHDLTGIRILVSSIRDCYAALGAVHARWNPMPGRFKDYIATPKFNLYQSLHTTVFGPEGRPVEIQIRTNEMHHRAEFGVAAHWKYKENQKTGTKDRDRSKESDTYTSPSTQQTEMAWLAHLSDWQEDTQDPEEFLDTLRYEIGAKEVYVFTPKGKVIGLPAGATPVDFAYAVHTEVGHRTMGAKVNGRLVPLDTRLGSGDTIEIFTSKNPDAGPSKDWLGFVTSHRARSKIRQWFTKERRDESIEQGKDAIARAMRKQNLPLKRLMSQDSLATVLSHFHIDSVENLYQSVGEGRISTQSVIEKLIASVDVESDSFDDQPTFVQKARARPRTSESGILVRGAPDILVKLSKCCTPVPGDKIVGFVTRGQGVSVHRADCTNVESLMEKPDRVIDVEWAPTKGSVFLVHIQIEALDRPGLLSDVTRVLSEHHVNILSATVHTSAQRLALSRFVFEMGDVTHLERVLNSVRKIDAVYDVYRVTQA